MKKEKPKTGKSGAYKTEKNQKLQKTVTPQEIAVWYILPAIRRALAQEMAKNGMRQKEIASQLGITESAVSQYVSSKRGTDLKLPEMIEEDITKSARRIMESKKALAAFQEIQRITKLIMDTHAICEIHHGRDKSLPKQCDICFVEP